MTSRDVVRRLRAFEKGVPLPHGSTKHVAVADDSNLLVVAFVRMGGEARPWGIAFGHPGSDPTILSVPEGRNRDLVAAMTAEFAPTLLAHLRTPGYVVEDPTDWEDLVPLHQIWVPNASHLDMLHHLAYAYTFTKWGGGKLGRLNKLGRASGWLFREAQRAGEQTIVTATTALKDAYTFPAQDVQQGHLGFLLAWLDASGDRTTRLTAAREAERRAVSTSLDPAIERDRIESELEAWHSAGGADSPTAKPHAARIAGVLEEELLHRFNLTVQAVHHLRNDPRNTNQGIAELVTESMKEQWYQFTRMELRIDDPEDGPAFIASPETDRYPAAAASRYMVHLASEDQVYSALVHDDREMQVEAIAAGDAFDAVITDVWDEGNGRSTVPVWTVVADGRIPTRMRLGAWICIAGTPKRRAKIRSVTDMANGTREFELEIIGWKTIPRAAPPGLLRADDDQLIGTNATFVKNSAEGINRRKSQRVWSANVPGAWLTHARPKGPKATLPLETAEDLQSINPIMRDTDDG